MIKTYINPMLVAELQIAFPNGLPTEADYSTYNNNPQITPEQIAFRAGIQHVIHYLRENIVAQENSEDMNGVEITI